MNQITAIKEGIESAFEEVYHDFHEKAFRFYFKRVRLHETAKELTQELFIKLWHSRHTLSEDFTLDTQIFTIAGTVFIDHLRKQYARDKMHTAVREEMIRSSHQQTQSPGHAMETADYMSVLVNRLTPLRKKVILLKTKNGFSNKEIASRLSISEKTVESHITMAIRKIKSLSSIQ
jgi:RNA polymerase sigma factor (sigma-70 family)